ncbi:MAG: TetR/AcrR family transcriptional regulator [Acidimicrobiia bacterium]
MPLPRFTRLPEDQRRHILDVARRELAQEASYNQIIAAAGISKTSAYLYFDGKQDLVDEVLRDLAADLAGVLGPWSPAEGADEFWVRLRADGDRLAGHLMAHPSDAAVMGRWYEEVVAHGSHSWVRAMVADGRRLGVIRSDLDSELLVIATASVIHAADRWVVDALARGESANPDVAWKLLAGMWS